MGFIHLQIDWNPWLGGYHTQILILSALYPQLNLLNPPPGPRKKIHGGLGMPLDAGNLFPRVKQHQSDDEHSTTSTAKIKNVLGHKYIVPICF
jgi:hypothetical protein